jgi:hypothetical protein
MVARTEYGTETVRLLKDLDSLQARRSMSSFLPAGADSPHD